MDDRGLVITRKGCMIFLMIYAASVFIWDYTIAYQAALVLMVGCALVLYRGRLLRLSPYVAVSGLFLLYFIVHTCLGLSTAPRLSIDYLVTLCINLVAVMSVICIVDSREKIEMVLKTLIVAAVAIWIYVIIVDRAHWFTGTLGGRIEKPIFGGKYSHNNLPMLAGYAVLFLSYFRLKNKNLKWVYFLDAFFLVCVLLSGARKALLFMLLGLFAYPLMLSKKPEQYVNKTIKFTVLIVCVVMAFVLIMTNETLYAVIGHRFVGFLDGLVGGTFTESSARSRMVMLQTALNTVREHFLLGIGLNTFRTLEGSFGTWSHNNFLEIMVSGGILPLLIYYSFPVYAFVKLMKTRRDPLSGMFMTYLIYIVIHDLLSISYNARNLGLMMSLIAAYLLIREREIRGAQDPIFITGALPQGERAA